MKTLEKPSNIATLAGLIQQIERAVLRNSAEEAVLEVRDALRDAIRTGADLLPDQFLQPTVQSYARRLVHMDPDSRFSIMAMVWGPGQGTPLHDHDGLWVVECVYRGKVKVTNFEPRGIQNDLHQFSVQSTEEGFPGDSDYRIPPFEHHILENAQAEPSVTFHVFGGSMHRCNTYEPGAGGYRRIEKDLAFTPW